MSKCTPTNRVRNYLSQPAPFGEFDALLKQFLNTPIQSEARSFGAPVSLWETDGHYHFEVDAPGVEQEDVDIEVDHGELVVSLERNRSEEAPKFLHNERSFGKTKRTVTLPETADVESIEANLTGGVLSVTIAKLPEAKPRKIDVKID